MKSLKILVLIIIVILSINSISYCDEVNKNITLPERAYKNITLYDGEEVKVSCLLNGVGYRYHVLFSDGSSFTRESYTGYSVEGSSASLSTEQIGKAEKAIEIYIIKYGLPKRNKPKSPGMFFASLLLIIVGIVKLLAPEFCWYLEVGWKFNDAEPSEISLIAGRILGGIFIFVGIILLFS